MAKKSQTISKKLNSVYVLITNINGNEELKNSLLAFGYSPDLLIAGENLYNDVMAIIDQWTQTNKEKLETTGLLEEKAAQAFKLFVGRRRLARLSLRGNDQMLSALGLSRRLPWSLEGKIDLAIKFYNTAMANPELVTILTPIGLTLEKLQQGLAAINELKQLNAKQEEKIGVILFIQII